MAGCPEKHCEHAAGECPGENAFGKGIKCPRDQKLGCSIADSFHHKQTKRETHNLLQKACCYLIAIDKASEVETTKKEVCAGPSTRFLSWTWSYKVTLIMWATLLVAVALSAECCLAIGRFQLCRKALKHGARAATKSRL